MSYMYQMHVKIYTKTVKKKILWSWLPNPFNNNKVIQTELVDGLTR